MKALVTWGLGPHMITETVELVEEGGILTDIHGNEAKGDLMNFLQRAGFVLVMTERGLVGIDPALIQKVELIRDDG